MFQSTSFHTKKPIVHPAQVPKKLPPRTIPSPHLQNQRCPHNRRQQPKHQNRPLIQHRNPRHIHHQRRRHNPDIRPQHPPNMRTQPIPPLPLNRHITIKSKPIRKQCNIKQILTLLPMKHRHHQSRHKHQHIRPMINLTSHGMPALPLLRKHREQPANQTNRSRHNMNPQQHRKQTPSPQI